MTRCALASLLYIALAARSNLRVGSPCGEKGAACGATKTALDSLSSTDGISLLQVKATKKKGNPTAQAYSRSNESRKVRPKKDARIAIVGAGPAGIHMAMELQKLGYRNVTILERSDRIGGRTFTLYRDSKGMPCNQTQDPTTGRAKTDECIAFDMGASLLHNGYHTVRALVKEYGLVPEVAPPDPVILSELSPCDSCGLTLSDFVGAGIMKHVHAGTIQVPFWVPKSTSFIAAYALMDAAARYNSLSHEIFGDVEFTLPERLPLDKLDRIDMSFKQFLEKNRLHALEQLLKVAHTSQGYGYLGSVHAFYGLLSVSPEVMNGLVQQILHQVQKGWLGAGASSDTMKSMVHMAARFLVGGEATGVEQTYTMLPEGFQKLWQRIAEQENLNIRFNIRIVDFGIDRQLDEPEEPILITHRPKGQKKTVVEKYDEVFHAAPIAQATRTLLDITDKEREILRDFKTSSLVKTLYISDSARDDHVYDARHLNNKSGEGHGFSDGSSQLVFGSTGNEGSRLRTAVQFYESACTLDPKLCEADHVPHDVGFAHEATSASATLLEDLRANGENNAQILQQFAWTFFPRFSRQGIRKGYMWDLLERQGLNRIWWLGAGATFDSVHDVVNYNNMLLKRYFGAQATGDGARRKFAGGVSL